MPNHKSKIISAVEEFVKAGAWRKVTYSSRGTRKVDTSRKIEPDTVLVNDVSSSWGEPVRNKRTPNLKERSDWTFELNVDFSSNEIDSEEFEEAFELGLVIPADPTLGQRQIIVELIQGEYDHPPRQQAQSGSKMVYTLRALLASK